LKKPIGIPSGDMCAIHAEHDESKRESRVLIPLRDGYFLTVVHSDSLRKFSPDRSYCKEVKDIAVYIIKALKIARYMNDISEVFTGKDK
jgi:hypothetical protein